MVELPPKIAARVLPIEDCLVWTGALTRGYGRVLWGTRVEYVHRVVYWELVGPISEGLEIDHLCRNKACVNPAHLEAVTHAMNLARSAPATKTHCAKGHLLTGRQKPHNRRFCRVCAAERARQRRDRAKRCD